MCYIIYMSKSNFKVGDRVIILKNQGIRGLLKNNVYTVKEVNDGSIENLEEFDLSRWFFNDSIFKLVEENPLGNTIRGDGEYITKDSGKRVQFDSGFTRDTNEGKPLYNLIPHELLTRLAGLYTRGKLKYGKDNWKKASTPEEYERFQESAFRHFVSWVSGVDDKEDHAIACIWNIMSYEWHIKHKKK